MMKFRFGMRFCSILGDENSDAGHIKCSNRPQVSHLWHKVTHKTAC